MFDEMKREQVKSADNRAYTENGATAYATTGKNLLDLNFGVPNLRTLDHNTIDKAVRLAYNEDPVMFVKWLFFLRDCRGGLGEKYSFNLIFEQLALYNEDFAIRVLPLIPEYGSWKDVVLLADSNNEKIADRAMNLIKSQLESDLENIRANGSDASISLLGKWLPSINAGKAARMQGKKVLRKLGLTFKQYRVMLSKLRETIDIVERKMCANDFKNINYSAVPSIAGLKYRNSFMKHDYDRYSEFINKANSGEAKINTSVLFPHEVYAKYNCSVRAKDDSIEAFWKNLDDKLSGNASTMVVCDGSGSMTMRIPRTNVRAIDVSRALSIYFSERLTGEFKDKFIEFSRIPRFIDLSNCSSLYDKKKTCERYDDCSNTNIEKVFMLMLKTAVNKGMSQEDMPDNVLIISDMEFDDATYSYWNNVARPDATLFKTIEKRYNDAGYKMPRLVFWNVNSRSGAIPVIENEMGVVLVSGYSTNICQMVCSGDTDPYKALVSVLNSERYKPIEEALTI